jgi:eukaryotic-like serine/threonine-protein kinase
VIGQKLGPYEVLEKLGQGGMGEVYRAKDTRLDRIVAVKVLPPALAADPQFRERFDREARAISALEHPHICALYDVGDTSADSASGEPVRFLVIQYLEGETLESRLTKGGLPVAEALTIAIQIADALATAHRAGIVHRDLKPGNIMLTRGGAKLLDFGLAKMSAPAIAVTGTMLPTTPAAVTAQGTILGTFQYMAPEQIEGLEADARSDIFAFGAVLYEMLTGKHAFEGKTRASLIGAILKDEPRPVSQIQPLAPSSLDRIVSTCLAKEPDDRWQTARDLLRELKWAASGSVAASTSVAPLPMPPSRRGVLVAASAGLAIGLIVSTLSIWIGLRLTARAPQLVRLEIVPPSAQRLMLATPDRHLAISPDGTRVVYIVSTPGANRIPQLFIRRIDELEGTPLDVPGVWPFFSPDGRWIGFFGSGELRKVSVNGGPAITLCRFNGFARGATWGTDGTIVFATTDLTTGLLAVPQGGGEPRVLTRPDNKRGEADHWYPFLLPDGRVLMTIFRGSGGGIDDNQIVLADVSTGAHTTLINGGSQAEFVEPGYLVYAAAGTMRAVRFDRGKHEATSDPVPVVERVLTFASGVADFAVSRVGTLVYVPGSGVRSSPRSLVWVDRKGREEPIDASLRQYDMPRVSPDGTRVALQITDPAGDIWIWDLARHTLTPLARIPGVQNLPVWTPDSRRIIFNSTESGPRNVFSMPADGTGVAERLTTSDNNQFPFSTSPDGTRLVIGEVASQTQADVRVMALDGAPPASGRRSEILVQTPSREYGGQISPDGRWLAYQSDESGQFEIYVRPFPDVNGDRVQISTAGGTRARWARSGRELFYLDSDDVLTAVAVNTSGERFSAGKPARVFERRYYSGFPLGSYDVSPDGQRFLMIKEDQPSADSAPEDRVVVVLNWLEDLKNRFQQQ